MRNSNPQNDDNRSVKSLLRLVIYNLLVYLAVGGAFLAGYLFHRSQVQLNLPVLKEAHAVLTEHALKDLPPDPALEYGMVHGMVQAFDDPYTYFLEPPQNELESNKLSSRYGGIGVYLSQDAEGYWLLYTYPEGPAVSAGIQGGDRLLRVDALEVLPSTPYDTVLAALRGPVGNSVSLEFARPPEYKVQTVEIKFAEYPLPSVIWHTVANEPRLGIVKVNLIAAGTADEILEAVAALSDAGATHFALDLRDNPGGLLDAGVDVARLFLKDGTVMEQQYRGRDVQTYEVKEPGPLADIPLAVLINKGSASAAEIAAGALQAHGRASLFGEPSFGKDIVQLIFPLSDGSSMHVSAARWWIPGANDESIAGVGLQPDISVPSAPDAAPDPVIQAVIRSFFGN